MRNESDPLAPPNKPALFLFNAWIWSVRIVMVAILIIASLKLAEGGKHIFGFICALIGLMGVERFNWIMRRSLRAAQEDDRYKTQLPSHAF